MINQWLTENKSEFICVIAGYSEDLTKSFFSYNAGLERRFPIRFRIESYSDEELGKIFIKKVKEFEWDIDCEKLPQIIKSNRKYFKFNGGDMEILFTKSKIAHSKNLLKTENKKKKTLTEKDILDGIKIFLENPEIKKREEEQAEFEKNNYHNALKNFSDKYCKVIVFSFSSFAKKSIIPHISCSVGGSVSFPFKSLRTNFNLSSIFLGISIVFPTV
jgi:hypothetical protein